MQKVGGDWFIFCNGQGWFGRASEAGRDYLKLGYVSSYLEINKPGAI